MSEINLDVSIVHKGITCPINYVQGTNTIPIIIRLTDYTIPTGSTVRIYIKKPSGHEVYNDCTFSGNVITINPTLQMFAEAGRQAGQIQVLNGQRILVSFPLVFDVEKNIIDDSLVSDNEYNTLGKVFEQALQAAQQAQKSAQAAANSSTAASNSATAALKSKTDAAVILEQTKQAKDNAIAAITDKCSSYAEIDKIKNVTLSGSAEGNYISVDDAASWRLSNLEVQGKSEQVQTTGKNLFDLKGFLESSKAQHTVSGDTYTINSAGSGYANPFQFSAIDQRVAISGTVASTAEVNFRLDILNEAGTVVGQLKSGVRSVTAVGCKLRLNYTTAAAPLGTLKNIQVEPGDTATAYEPYTGSKPAPSPNYPQEIKSVENSAITACGENLCSTLGTTQGCINYKNKNDIVTIDDDRVIVDCTKGSGYLDVSFKNLKPNTVYQVSVKIEGFTEGKLYRLLGSGDISANTIASQGGYFKKYITTDSSGEKVFQTSEPVFLYLIGTDGWTPGQKITFSEWTLSEKEATYEPYTGHTATIQDITLRSLPDGTVDRLEKRDGVWGIERKVGTKTYTGNETWSFYSKSSPVSFYTRNAEMNPGGRTKGYNSRFKMQVSPSGSTIDGCTVGADDGVIYITLSNNNITTIEAWKNWLSSNPFVVQYELKSHTWEPLPDTLQAELNKLESHAGTTNIFTDSPLQPTMKADYIKDPNKVITAITNAITSLGGNV